METRIVRTHDDLSELARRLESEPVFGLDYETTTDYPNGSTTQFDKMKPFSWGLGFPDQTAFYVPIGHASGENAPATQAIEILGRALGDQTKTVWAHHVKFESTASRVLGIDFRAQRRCSMIAQWLLQKGLGGGKGHGLKPAVEQYLGHKMLTWEEVVPAKMLGHQVPIEVMAPYCADDARQGLNLGTTFMKEIVDLKMEKVFVELEMPFTEVLQHMDEVGMAIDRARLTGLYDRYDAEMRKLADDFQELTGASITSNPSISRRLFEELKWWTVPEGVQKGKSGAYPLNAEHREWYSRLLKKGSPGWVAMALKDRYQAIQKICTTYTMPIIARADRYLDGRVRSDWKQHGTDTGRLSSSDPNLQNIPSRDEDAKQIRDAFVAEEGWSLVDADYSQADLVMMAHLSQDTNLLKAYNERLDVHQQTADACGCDRSTGKVLNLGLIYEMSAPTLAANLGCTQPKAEKLWKAWHAKYPAVQQYHKRMHKFAEEHGYVRTITGRIRYVPEIKSPDGKRRSYAKRIASNTPDQGSVADVIKIAMRNVHREWKERGVLFDWYTKEGKVKIVSQVHDELIVEARDDFKEEAAADLKRHMEGAVQLRAPMKATPKIARTWAEAH